MTPLVLAIATIGVLGAGAVSPPQPGNRDPLAIPTRGLLCRPNPPGSVGSGIVVVILVEEPADSVTEGRTFSGTFDSLGVPLSLVVTMHEKLPPDIDQLTAVGVEFGSAPKGVKAVGVVDSLVPASGGRPLPRREALTETELGHARRLAEWIWDHRCRKG